MLSRFLVSLMVIDFRNYFRTDIQDNRPDPPAVGPVPAAAAPANDAVPHEPQQRNAAAPVPAPVQVAAGPQPRVDGTAPAPSTAGSQSIPGFFIVTTNSVLLYGSPSLAGQLRTVYSKVRAFKKNFLL